MRSNELLYNVVCDFVPLKVKLFSKENPRSTSSDQYVLHAIAYIQIPKTIALELKTE